MNNVCLSFGLFFCRSLVLRRRFGKTISAHFWFDSNMCLKWLRLPVLTLQSIATHLLFCIHNAYILKLFRIWTPCISFLSVSVTRPSILSLSSFDLWVLQCLYNGLLFSRVELCFGTVWFWFDSTTTFFLVPYLFYLLCVYAWLDVSLQFALILSLALYCSLYLYDRYVCTTVLCSSWIEFMWVCSRAHDGFLFSSNFIKIVIFDENRQTEIEAFIFFSLWAFCSFSCIIPYCVFRWWSYFSSVWFLLLILLF